MDREGGLIGARADPLRGLLHTAAAARRCDHHGLILHDWNLEKKQHLIRLAYAALPPGGAFIAIENLIDDARRENAFGLMMSLNMLIEFGDAFDFTGADFWSWCRQAGFSRYEVIHLAGPCSAAIAYK